VMKVAKGNAFWASRYVDFVNGIVVARTCASRRRLRCASSWTSFLPKKIRKNQDLPMLIIDLPSDGYARRRSAFSLT